MSPQLGDYQLLYTNDDGYNTNAISIAESLIFNEMSRATEICKFTEVEKRGNGKGKREKKGKINNHDCSFIMTRWAGTVGYSSEATN